MKTNKTLKVFKTANTVKSVNNIHKVSTKHKTHKKSYNKHKYVKKSLIGGSGSHVIDAYFTNFHKKMGLLIGEKTPDNIMFTQNNIIKAAVFQSNIVLYAFLILYFITKHAFKINIDTQDNRGILTSIINDDIIPHINSQRLGINIKNIKDNKNDKENNNKLFKYLNDYFTDKDKIHVDVNTCLNITNNLDNINIFHIEIKQPTQPIAIPVAGTGYLEVIPHLSSSTKSLSSESSSNTLTPGTSAHSSLTLTPGSPPPSQYLSVDPSSSSGYINIGLSSSDTDNLSHTEKSSASLSFHSAKSTASSSYLSVGPQTEPALVTLSKTKERNEKLFGLHNIVNVCYITVCLQLLWQISDIRDALIDNTEINVSGVLLAIKNLFTNIDKNTENTLKEAWAEEDKQHGELERRDVAKLSDNYNGAYTFDTWPFFIEISKILPEITNNINYLKNKATSDAVDIMGFINKYLQAIDSFKHLIYHAPINDIILDNNKTIQNTIGTSNLDPKNDSNYIVLKINNYNDYSILTNTLSSVIVVNTINYTLKGCVVFEINPDHYVYYRYNNDGKNPEFRCNDSTVKQYNSDLNPNTSLEYITKNAKIVLYERTPLLPSKS